MRPAGLTPVDLPAGAGDVPGLLSRILARLVSIEALLRSQLIGRPEPIGRLLGDAPSQATAPRSVRINGSVPRPLSGEPATEEPRPTLVPDQRDDRKSSQAPPDGRGGGRRRRHTAASKAADRKRVRAWLEALDMNPAEAARAAGLNSGQLLLVLNNDEGISFNVERRMRALLLGRAPTTDKEA